MSESELAAEIEHRMRRLGAEKPAFDTIVAAGARSALPHASPGGAPRGGWWWWIWARMQDGYTSDMTRMLFAGRPGRKVKAALRAVLEAQLAALEAVRAGVPAGAVDRAARRVLRPPQLGARFRAFHRARPGPRDPRAPAPRQAREPATGAGMVITVEPGVYIEGFGGVRIEDTVVVTANGCEILTPTGKELRLV